MIDKLEVGMYVRYISSFQNNDSDKPVMFIGKILELDDYYIKLDTFRGGVYEIKDFINLIIGKPSFNPIDLIEVGDYVNGYKVLSTLVGNFEESNPYNVKALKLEYVKEDFNPKIPFFKRYICIINEDIKTVVTKEQFESMKYRLGDEN